MTYKTRDIISHSTCDALAMGISERLVIPKEERAVALKVPSNGTGTSGAVLIAPCRTGIESVI